MEITKEERQKEERHLEKTIEVVREQIGSLGTQLFDKEEKMKEFKELIWDQKAELDPGEMRNAMMENDLQVQLLMARGRYFQTLYKVQNSPYFGKIIFEEQEKEPQEIYIGITHVDKDNKHFVHDWRSPICSLFYDYEVGPASYIAPMGKIKGNLNSKRQFKIEYGKLIRIFDNSMNIDDDVLQEVLAEESNDKMKNIVNTIQQEQNKVIRNLSDKVLIVQGIAGSGKTSVALHRIAFLLYKIENLSSDNVLIFSPNKVFSEYISNVLPELGEANTLQTTFDGFLYDNIREYKGVETFTSFIERYYKNNEKNKELVFYKQSDKVIDDLENYKDELIKKLEFTCNIEIEKRTIPKEDLNEFLKDRYQHMLLMDRIDSIVSKICMTEFLGKKTNAKKIKSLLLKSLNIELNYKNLYASFFQSQAFKESFGRVLTDDEIRPILKEKVISFEDACLFIYLKGLLEGFTYRGRIEEVVIDEAQDYNKLQYKLIKNIFKKSSFTILGDVNQTINPYYKYNSLEELNEIWDDTTYLELKKTYRSSEEIIAFANKILGLNYVTAIRKKNNKEVKLRQTEDMNTLKDDLKTLEKEYKSVAIITKTDEEASKVYESLRIDFPHLALLENKTSSFNRHLVITPSYIAKGLEFDSVIIYTDKDNSYKEEEKYLYYVAVTRAQHELIVYNQK